MSSKLNEKEKKYLESNIMNPYLIHVEFEILNIYTRILNDKIIRKQYSNLGYNYDILLNTIESFIEKLHQLRETFNNI